MNLRHGATLVGCIPVNPALRHFTRHSTQALNPLMRTPTPDVARNRTPSGPRDASHERVRDRVFLLADVSFCDSCGPSHHPVLQIFTNRYTRRIALPFRNSSVTSSCTILVALSYS